jgi:hypothetical protein
MKCSDSSCGEIVIIAGDTKIDEVEDEEHGWRMESFLRPRSIFPAPPIIAIPKQTPSAVKQQLELAFQLFWSDLGASASRLRASVECLLDGFKIARYQIDAKKKKRFFKTLASRIELFKKHHAHGEILDALRHVGNLGTHSDVGRQSVLAGFEIYENALAEIYGKRTQKVKTLTKLIIKTKGKLK